MCILIATSDHPKYDLVLVSNRDEYFARKASPASWTDNNFMLCPLDKGLDTSGEDLGTWIGANRDGKIGTVLNLKLFSDPRGRPAVCPESRGKIPVSFLSSRGASFKDWDTYDKFCHQFQGLEFTRDFNFFYGDCSIGDYRVIDSLGNTTKVLGRTNEKYIVVSNDIFQGESNKNRVWDKISLADQALHHLVQEFNDTDEDKFIQECFGIASINPFHSKHDHGNYHMKAVELSMQTVFVPPLKTSCDDGLGASVPIGEYYGTRSQTVILVSKDRSHITFVERIIHDSDLDALQYSRDHYKEQKRYDFDLPH